MIGYKSPKKITMSKKEYEAVLTRFNIALAPFATKKERKKMMEEAKKLSYKEMQKRVPHRTLLD